MADLGDIGASFSGLKFFNFVTPIKIESRIGSLGKNFFIDNANAGRSLTTLSISGASANSKIILSSGVRQIGAFTADANGVFIIKGLNTGTYRALELGTARVWEIQVIGANFSSFILSEEGDRINAGFSFGGIS